MNLHSNMDRLKPRVKSITGGSVFYLHSNMDRLKQRSKTGFWFGLFIYIPIWID